MSWDPASWSAPWPGLANWESLTGNSFALHQPQDVNTVEMWCPSRVLGKEAPVIKAVGVRHLSVHQILRVTLPISALKEYPGKGGSSSGSPALSPTPSHLLVLLYAGSGQGDPEHQDSKQVLGPGYYPIIPPRVTAVQSSGAGRRRQWGKEGMGIISSPAPPGTPS